VGVGDFDQPYVAAQSNDASAMKKKTKNLCIPMTQAFSFLVAQAASGACGESHPQSLNLRLAEAEPAEDLGIVLAELGGDGAHPHALADLDRGADVRDFA
jgi:hypothetical protein